MKRFFYLFASLLFTITATATPGLNFSYYEGSWSMLPDFSTLTAIKTGVTTNADLSPRNRNDQYAFVWKGFITVPAAGNYTFETISDDGSKLYIGTSAVALVNNDGLHAGQSRTGTISLTAGAHPITITFFEGTLGETMQVYWSSNTGISRQLIPDNVLSTTMPVVPSSGLNFSYYEGSWNTLPDFNALTPVKTGVSSNPDISPRNRNDLYAFSWKGFITVPATGNYTFETISDDGSKLYIGTSATALVNNDGLHASQSRFGTISLTAGSHPITITFFEKDGGETMEVYWSSNTGISRQRIPDNVLSTTMPANPSSGLNFSYYEGTWNTLPDFNALTPVKTGASSNIDITPRHTNERFAFVWKGLINIPSTGNYTFETISDDGSKLYIGDYSYTNQPLVNNDGLHSSQSRSATLNLTAGMHPITITFFENDGGETMEVYWSSNTGITRQRIPDQAFTSTASKGEPEVLPLPQEPTDDLRGNVNYYFSTSTGDDNRTAAQAQNEATPWKTIFRLNAILPTLQPGNAVLFRRGDTFQGAINITRSGSDAASIIFSSYGSGAKPVVSGMVTLSGWTSLGNNTWETACPSNTSVNMVTIQDVVQGMGRYPNLSAPGRGYLSIDSYYSNRQITDAQLAGTPNWTGAEVVIRKNNWVLDRAPITSHSGNTLSYTSSTGHEPGVGNGYFVQNSPSTLDQDGEWYFNPSSKKLRIYSSVNPSTLTIKASVIDEIVHLEYINNITFDNISFHGADQHALLINTSRNIRIQNCDVNFSGVQGISGGAGDHIIIANTSFNNTNNDAIELYRTSNTTLKNNRILNTGLIPGMGQSNNQQHEAIFLEGANNLIEANIVLNTGYSAITFAGEGAVVKNNFVNYFCLTVDDGGGIYGWGDMDKLNRKVTGNIILNGIGAHEGTGMSHSTGANGIMMDDRSAHVEFSNNTIANCSRAGIFLHNSRDMVISNNTIYNNNTSQLLFGHDNIAPEVPITNIRSTGNILFSKAPTQYIMEVGSLVNDAANLGSMDNNYYARPLDEKGIIATNYPNGSSTVNSYFDLGGWNQSYGYDQNSSITPVKIPSYIVSRYNSGNLFINGSFNNNSSGAFCQSAPGRCLASWNSGGKLDGGALQVTFDGSTGTNDVGTYVELGNVQAGKKYLIRFNLLGSKSGQTMKGFMLQHGGNYNHLSDTRFFELTNSRTEQEFLFTPTVSEPVILAMEISGTHCPFWLDNFQVYEVDVTTPSADEYIRFEYNASFQNKTVALDGNYIDVKSNVYNGEITLEPFTSAVLIKQITPAAAAPALAARESEMIITATFDLKITPNPATEKIHVTVSQAPGTKQSFLAIRSITGAAMKTIALRPSDNAITTVDVSTWPSGIYIVTLSTNGKLTSKKFVKK